MKCLLSWQNFEVSHLLIHSQKLKHEVTYNLLILDIFKVYSMNNKLLFIQSVTKKCNLLIQYYRKMSKLCPNFLRFCLNFWQLKTFCCSLSSPCFSLYSVIFNISWHSVFVSRVHCCFIGLLSVARREVSEEELRRTVASCYSAEGRIACGERYRVLGKRIVPTACGSRVEYLIEWEGFTAQQLHESVHGR